MNSKDQKWYRGQWVKFTYPKQEGFCLYKIRSLAKNRVKVCRVGYTFDWDGVLITDSFRFGDIFHPGGRVESYRIDPLTPEQAAEYLKDGGNSAILITGKTDPFKVRS